MMKEVRLFSVSDIPDFCDSHSYLDPTSHFRPRTPYTRDDHTASGFVGLRERCWPYRHFSFPLWEGVSQDLLSGFTDWAPVSSCIWAGLTSRQFFSQYILPGASYLSACSNGKGVFLSPFWEQNYSLRIYSPV